LLPRLGEPPRGITPGKGSNASTKIHGASPCYPDPMPQRSHPSNHSS
jgi:hypothetical protein